jgi:SAM-dependent methyltransferase
VKERHSTDWEERARREPYFAVLTNEGTRGVEGNSIATAAYFETGEADTTALLSAVRSLLGRDIVLTTSLDFGCGVGRLTLPLARRATRVVACDIAPTMLAHARQNAEKARLRNVTFLDSDELAGLPQNEFDFVCSLLVFKYIPPSVGYRLIRTLINVLAPGGIAALHVTFGRHGATVGRLARLLRTRSRFAHRVVRVVQGGRFRSGRNRVNEYEERIVLQCIEAAGARPVGQLPTHQGAVLVIEKLVAPVGSA